jgi:regulator of cell morphogenesis and NO signaling
MTTTRDSLTIDAAATVNEILSQHPATVSVFNDFGIDACCGGDASLAEAARRDDADIVALIAALDLIIDRPRTSR